MSGFDIIGDIHGQGTRLDEFLKKLGYHGLKHPDGRKIIFMGDFIDRGTEHAKTLHIVRSLMEEGTAQAVVGNHEFNAICYAREGRKGPIRAHTPQNTGDHADFLHEYPYGTKAYKKVIKWFETLPVYIENKDFRVVHACWDDRSLSAARPYMNEKDHSLKSEAYGAYDLGKATPFYNAINILIKGPEYDLPKGVSFLDTSGFTRTKTRMFWWPGKEASAFDVLEKGSLIDGLPETESNRIVKLRNRFNYESQKTVFIGHYNIDKPVFLVAPIVACVNFKHQIMAYRWDKGDKGLDPAKLVCL